MIEGINHITLAVSDIDISLSFYRDILGLTLVVRWRNGAYLTAGDMWIALNKDDAVTSSRRQDYSHIAFSISAEDFHGLKQKINEYGAREWSHNTSEGDSFYFEDPDGHRLEIHVGDLVSRLKDMEVNPWDEFFFK